MVLPVHLQLSAVVAIVNCRGRSQFNDSRSLKQAALQPIWLFQESLCGLVLAADKLQSVSINCRSVKNCSPRTNCDPCPSFRARCPEVPQHKPCQKGIVNFVLAMAVMAVQAELPVPGTLNRALKELKAIVLASFLNHFHFLGERLCACDSSGLPENKELFLLRRDVQFDVNHVRCSRRPSHGAERRAGIVSWNVGAPRLPPPLILIFAVGEPA